MAREIPSPRNGSDVVKYAHAPTRWLLKETPAREVQRPGPASAPRDLTESPNGDHPRSTTVRRGRGEGDNASSSGTDRLHKLAQEFRKKYLADRRPTEEVDRDILSRLEKLFPDVDVQNAFLRQFETGEIEQRLGTWEAISASQRAIFDGFSTNMKVFILGLDTERILNDLRNVQLGDASNIDTLYKAPEHLQRHLISQQDLIKRINIIKPLFGPPTPYDKYSQAEKDYFLGLPEKVQCFLVDKIEKSYAYGWPPTIRTLEALRKGLSQKQQKMLKACPPEVQCAILDRLDSPYPRPKVGSERIRQKLQEIIGLKGMQKDIFDGLRPKDKALVCLGPLHIEDTMARILSLSDYTRSFLYNLPDQARNAILNTLLQEAPAKFSLNATIIGEIATEASETWKKGLSALHPETLASIAGLDKGTMIMNISKVADLSDGTRAILHTFSSDLQHAFLSLPASMLESAIHSIKETNANGKTPDQLKILLDKSMEKTIERCPDLKRYLDAERKLERNLMAREDDTARTLLEERQDFYTGLRAAYKEDIEPSLSSSDIAKIFQDTML